MIVILNEVKNLFNTFGTDAMLVALLREHRPVGVSRVAWLRVLAEYLLRCLRFSG